MYRILRYHMIKLFFCKLECGIRGDTFDISFGLTPKLVEFDGIKIELLIKFLFITIHPLHSIPPQSLQYLAEMN